MKKEIFFLLFICLGQIKAQISKSLPPELELFSIQSLSKHYYNLSDDSLLGRGTGSNGCVSASNYIANELRKIGIKPVGENNTYFQKIPMHGSIPKKTSKLKIISDGIEKNLELGKDYLLYRSGAQTFIPNPVPLVFAGYGIFAPEFDYNDYQSIDVEGKIVVILSGEPHSNDNSYFDGLSPSIYSYPEAKQRIAFSRGARGSIIIPNPFDDKTRSWEYRVNQFTFEDVTLAYTVTGNLSVLMNPVTAEMLFEEADYSFSHVLEMSKKNSVVNFPLKVQMSFYGDFSERDFISSNVIGLLQGSDPILRNSYLLLTAHYDHLGVGSSVKGDSIYNGTIDNSSGTSALLEIARIFSLLNDKPRRSIVFLFLTGEEKGLLGSKFYTEHPVFPLYKTVANINIDGIAFWDLFESIIGIGAEFSSLNKYLSETAELFDLKISAIPQEFLQSESFSYSDQFEFARAGIPAILISEGIDFKNSSRDESLHKMLDWMKNVYHSPFDDLNQKINFEAALLHTKVIYTFGYLLANLSEEPEWNAGAPFINARLQSIAEKK